MRLKQYLNEIISRKVFVKAEKDARDWSKDPDNQVGSAWVIKQGNKLTVASTDMHFKGEVLSRWKNGQKEVDGLLLRYYKIGDGYDSLKDRGII